MIRPPALVFGVPVDDLTMSETVDRIGALVSHGRSTGRTHQVATVNVDFLANAFAQPELLTILQHADVCLADGMPVVWSARAMGMELRERVAGADLVPRLIERSQQTGWRIHVFGSSPDVAERSRRLVAERWPDASVTIDPGPMIPDPRAVDADVIDTIATADADVLCVALGNPKQEHFIDEHRDRIGAPVMIGVGGSLDMLVGERKRAPGWMQRTGLEWVARAAQEPRRLGTRYAHDIRTVGPRLGRDWRAHRTRSAAPDVRIDVEGDGGDGCVAVVLGASEPATIEQYDAAVGRIGDGARVEVRPNANEAITQRSAAALVGLVRAARAAGSSVTWSEAPAPILVEEFARLAVPSDLYGAS